MKAEDPQHFPDAPYAVAVRKILADHRLRQCELAQLIGMSGSSVGHWSTGVKKPSSTAVRKLCDVFDMKPEDFIIGPRQTDLEESIAKASGLSPEDRRDFIRHHIDSLNDLASDDSVHVEFFIKADGKIGARMFQEI